MSTSEYNDLFIKCQNDPDAIYQVFTFDLVNSRNLNNIDLKEAEDSLVQIIKEVYLIIKKIEKVKKKKILVFEEDFNFLFDENQKSSGFGLKTEPFKLGDMVGLTMYRDSLLTEEVIAIFDSVKTKYNYKYPLHYANGYYETNDYNKANEKYFRGYCIDIVSSMHKENIKKQLQKAEKQIQKRSI